MKWWISKHSSKIAVFLALVLQSQILFGYGGCLGLTKDDETSSTNTNNGSNGNNNTKKDPNMCDGEKVWTCEYNELKYGQYIPHCMMACAYAESGAENARKQSCQLLGEFSTGTGGGGSGECCSKYCP